MYYKNGSRTSIFFRMHICCKLHQISNLQTVPTLVGPGYRRVCQHLILLQLNGHFWSTSEWLLELHRKAMKGNICCSALRALRIKDRENEKMAPLCSLKIAEPKERPHFGSLFRCWQLEATSPIRIHPFTWMRHNSTISICRISWCNLDPIP